MQPRRQVHPARWDWRRSVGACLRRRNIISVAGNLQLAHQERASMLTLAALASTVRHQRACCYSATLLTGLRVTESLLNWAARFYRLWDTLCTYLRCSSTESIRQKDETSKDETVSLVCLLSCLCVASDWVPARLFGLSAVLLTRLCICVSGSIFCLFDLHVSCVAVQGVNGHFRKVTVWGRKDSIVYRHSPCSWRWTTMVSFIYLYI